MTEPDAAAPLTGVVLVGGRSTRMGRDKALLTLPNGLTLLDQAIATLRTAGVSQIFVSVRLGQTYGRPDTREIADATENCGPLAGLVAAFDAAQTNHIAVLAVDLPAMTPSFLRKLIARCTTTSGAVPHENDFFEPLVAIYSRRAAESARAALAAGRFSLQTWVSKQVATGQIQPVKIEPAETGLFTNWNRPEDYSGADSP